MQEVDVHNEVRAALRQLAHEYFPAWRSQAGRELPSLQEYLQIMCNWLRPLAMAQE